MTRTLTSDAAGNVLTSTDARSVTTVNASPSSRVFTVGYGYTSGRQSSITYPSGRLVAYGFDAQGRITSIAVDGTAVLGSVDYTAFGPPSKWTWANSQVMERTFDGDGLLKSYTSGPSSGTYSDLEQVFGYDAVNRLVSATLAAGQTQAFAYDAVGNRTSATLNSATTTYTYPGTNHKLSGLSGATTRSFAYDGAGNVTSTLGLTYVYDGRGRLKQAGATTYLVNGLGQRVKKGGGSEIFFAYDEQGHLIGEYDSTGAAIEETLWLGDTPVATLKPNGAGGFTVYYIWTDHLNTPRLITDAANNKRWEWAHNDPFGNNAANENPSGLGQFTYNLRFPGQYYDAETGNHYNYFRDYDPRIGRYIQSDPIGLNGGFSTFGYANQSPAIWSDETGTVANFVIGAVTGFATGYAVAWLTGDECYSFQDALQDAALGAVGAGLVSKLNKLYRVSRLRNIAESRGMQNLGQKGYTETWKNPSNSLERLRIKQEAGKSTSLGPGSKVPRFDFRTDAGRYWDPFTGQVGPKGALSHVPLEPEIPIASAAAGAIAGVGSRGTCGCSK